MELPINFLVAIAGEGDKIPEKELDLLVPAMLDKRDPYKINRSETKGLNKPKTKGWMIQHREQVRWSDGRWRMPVIDGRGWQWMATKPPGLGWTEGGESNGKDGVAIGALVREIGAKMSP